MKIYLTITFCLLAIFGCGQYTFNEVHTVSCIQPPFNYIPNAELHDVFIVNNPGSFNDGYLVFGSGITVSPSEYENPGRVFSLRCNNYGQLVGCNDYFDTLDYNSQFGSYNFTHMIINHRNRITGIRYLYDVGALQENLYYIDEYSNLGERLSATPIPHNFESFAINGLAQDNSDSTYVFVGQYRDSISIVDNVEPPGCLVKVDTLGNILWQQTYPGSIMFYNVTVDNNGYWIVGYDWLDSCPSLPSTIDINMLLIRTDENGIELDRLELDGACFNDWAFIEKLDEELLLAGMLTNDEPIPDCDPTTGYYFTSAISFNELNSEIELIGEWKTYDNWCNGHHPSAFIKCTDGGFAFSEVRASPTYNQVAGGLFKLNSNLDSLWIREYVYYELADVFTRNEITCIQPTADSGFVCVGYIRHGFSNIPFPNYLEPWIFKTDQFGCIEPGCHLVGLEEIIIGLENSMTVYPNPVHDIAHIQFSFADLDKIRRDFPDSRLIVTDITGKILHSQSLQLTPDLNIELNVTGYAPGIYIAHWTDGNRWLDSVKIMVERE